MLLAALSVPTISMAAPVTYQAAVTGNLPYVYYRQQETNIADGTTAADLSGNSRAGEYNGAPIGGVAGAGVLSDTAVQYSGTGTAAAAQYLSSPSARSFGNLVGTSSYEFLYKTNTGFSSTAQQSLFGVFSPSATPLDVEVTLNSRGNDALGALANTTRLYIKGQDGDGAGVHFTNAALYDGNYHHLVFTFDASQTGVNGFRAYVDGIAQTLTFTSVATTATDGDTDPDTFAKDFDFIPTFAGRNVRGTAVDGNGLQRLANVTLDEAALYGTVLSPAQVAANATAAGFIVPEPTSLAALGIAAVAGIRRRRA